MGTLRLVWCKFQPMKEHLFFCCDLEGQLTYCSKNKVLQQADLNTKHIYLSVNLFSHTSNLRERPIFIETEVIQLKNPDRRRYTRICGSVFMPNLNYSSRARQIQSKDICSTSRRKWGLVDPNLASGVLPL